MGIDVSVGGGKVSQDLSQATHMVVVSVPGSSIDFETLLKSFPSEEKRVLCKKKLCIVRCQWLEDCLANDEKMSETSYSLKPIDLEESISDDECKVDARSDSASPKHEAEMEPTPPARSRKLVVVNREPKRKGTRSAETGAQKRKLNVRQPRRTRARLASRAAKLHEDASDETFPVDQADQPKNEVTEAHDSDHTYENRSPKVLHQEAFSPVRSNVQSEPKPNIHADEKTNHESSDNAISFEPDRNRLTSPSAKLEIMVDPVHAMLLDMIPSLGLKKVGSGIPVENNQSSATDVPKAKPSGGEAGEVVKKKRVSYKDMANELLKDW